MLHPGRLVELGGEAGRILATAVQGSDARFQVAALLLCLAAQCPEGRRSFRGSDRGGGVGVRDLMDQGNNGERR